MTNYEKYKIVLLSLFIAGFLFCFYEYSKNGRYIPTVSNWHIDTRTGDIYSPIGKKINR